MLLNSLPRTGQPLMTKTYLVNVLIVPRLRNPDQERNGGFDRVVVMEL